MRKGPESERVFAFADGLFLGDPLFKIFEGEVKKKIKDPSD
jgi:hypothetical protein